MIVCGLHLEMHFFCPGLFQVILPSFLGSQFAVFETFASLVDKFLEGREVPDADGIVP